MFPTIRLAIVLLNYRGAADTLACIDSLLAGSHGFWRLYIADNASPDGSMDILRRGLQDRRASLQAAQARWGENIASDPLAMLPLTVDCSRADLLNGKAASAWVTLVDNQANWGFAAGNNVPLRSALHGTDATHFWLLNNDTEVRPDTLRELTQAIAQRPEIDLWGNTVLYFHDPSQVQALGGGSLNRRTGETRHVAAFRSASSVEGTATEIHAVEAEMDYALGASMVASRKWLEQVGLLSEDYFLYYEELDWATRGRAVGLRMGFAPRVVVLHKEGASIGTTPSGGSPLSVRHLARSRMIYVRKFLPRMAVGSALGSIAWRAAKYLLRGRHALALAALRGAMAGLRFSPTGREKT